MNRDLPRRFWVEGVLAGASTVLAVLTALWEDWIEIVFRVDPDHSSGEVEWLVVSVLVVGAVVCTMLARTEFRRVRPAT